MTQRISRRLLLSGLGSTVASTAFANAPLRSLRPQARAADFHKKAVPSAADLIAQAGLGGKIGFVVSDARSGEVLEVHNPVLRLPPASVAKTITSAYGLAKLGADHRFATQVLATGPIAAGVVQGDLVLVGGGDPTLDTNALQGLVEGLRARGITGVTGKFLVNGAALPYQQTIDPSQPDYVGYSPAVSGLNLNYNRVHFEWKKAGQGYDVAMDARSDVLRPNVTMAKMQIIDRKTPVFTYEDAAGTDRWTVARAALGGGGSRWLPVRRPDLYAGEVFQVLARSAGLRLPRPEISSLGAGEVVASHDSDPLSEVARGMMKYSTNLTAEVIGLSATASQGALPDTLASSGAQMSDWARAELGLHHIDFHDHSGLSDASRISASDMVKALNAAGPGGALEGLMKVVNPRDGQGRVVKEAPYSIRAKTGTLNFVSSLAGYLTAPDGRRLTFAIFTGDVERRAALTKAERERPQGGKNWARRSRNLQQRLLERWAVLYGT